MKKFFKHQPADRGRIIVTVETDMVAAREFWQLLGDLPEAIAQRVPHIPKAVEAVVKAISELSE
jgi:hypothetical protein